MDNILHIFKQIADNENITITKLEQIIGASKGVLSRALQKNTDIQSKWLLKVVEYYPHYSTDWLLTGVGDMLRQKKENIQIDEPNPIRDKLIARQDQLIEFLENENKNLKQDLFLLKKDKQPSFYTGFVAEDREELTKKYKK